MACPLLQLGSTGTSVATLRKLLAARMPEAAFSAAQPEVFDAKLKELVELFQRRNGLSVDGKVGANETWPALGVSCGSSLTVDTAYPSNSPHETPDVSGAGTPFGPASADKSATTLVVVGLAAAALFLFLRKN